MPRLFRLTIVIMMSLALGLALGMTGAQNPSALCLSYAEAQPAPSGEDLVKRLNCLACHALAGTGGDRGPRWDGLGNRLTKETIKKQIVSPQGRMPNYAHLKPAELDAVVQYLSGLK